MTRVVIALLFLAGCTSQMYVPQILMCLFLSMFLEVMLLSNIIFTYLLMGLMFCLIFILKTSMMVSNMKKHSP